MVYEVNVDIYRDLEDMCQMLVDEHDIKTGEGYIKIQDKFIQLNERLGTKIGFTDMISRANEFHIDGKSVRELNKLSARIRKIDKKLAELNLDYLKESVVNKLQGITDYKLDVVVGTDIRGTNKIYKVNIGLDYIYYIGDSIHIENT